MAKDYEKKYKEIVGLIKKAYLYAQTDSTKAVLEEILPELAESEDERIKKELIQFVKGYFLDETSEQRKTYLAWLEKQGEQRSAWTPMDEQHVENLLALIEGHGYPGEVAWLNSLEDRVQPKQGEQKPAWSEEDERIRKCLIRDQEKALEEVKNDKYGHSEIISDLKEIYRKRIDWLKSLKDKVGCEVNCTTTKEWSEEDYNEIETIACHLDNIGNGAMAESLLNIINKYKSFRPQNTWKPTGAQLASLEIACDRNDRIGFDLTELLRDLKKLKG